MGGIIRQLNLINMYRVKEINPNEKPLFLRAFKTFDDAIAYVNILYRTKKWKVYEIEYKTLK